MTGRVASTPLQFPREEAGMRIVIIGASGNVGTALLRRLRETRSGDELVGLVRRPPDPVGEYRGVDWHALDVSDQDAVGELGRHFADADTVVNLAWGFQPTREVDYLERVGVGGTAAVLEAAQSAGVGHLVHISSVGTYAPGRHGEHVDEDWARTGVPSSAYSRHKAAAEKLIDEHERHHGADAVPVARVRPGFIVQRAAASGLTRYGLPAYLPAHLMPRLPLLPLDRDLCLPLIHAEDVADALVRVIDQGATGPFNLATDPPFTRNDLAEVFGARSVHVPLPLLGAIVGLAWRARLQPVDRGWLDLAYSVPLLDCGRARDELGWTPSWAPREAMADLLDGIAHLAHTGSAPLRRRSVPDLVRRDLTEGLISSRRFP
ncbi:NAD-dependent epimerase/dehydratase family protein [Dietzia sp. UCD-THP]|uniref:NAD-dependent epimerase/dehydratase family protein n=1 Tax=Dietzia sp. UCD-THP TaxID=1292020 RepID=UPI001EE6694E|nr:NAD-dependent epimerase/dehydratase family protein [Dietzia sp. UCD-THP]